MFYTKWKKPKRIWEKLDEVPCELYDPAGYKDVKKRVEEFMISGERLEAIRKGEVPGVDDDFDGEASVLDDEYADHLDKEAFVKSYSSNIKKTSMHKDIGSDVSASAETQKKTDPVVVKNAESKQSVDEAIVTK